MASAFDYHAFPPHLRCDASGYPEEMADPVPDHIARQALVVPQPWDEGGSVHNWRQHVGPRARLVWETLLDPVKWRSPETPTTWLAERIGNDQSRQPIALPASFWWLPAIAASPGYDAVSGDYRG